ncbi:MAG: hypothetical protein ACPGPS_18435, partial [Rubripirellula sp.]
MLLKIDDFRLAFMIAIFVVVLGVCGRATEPATSDADAGPEVSAEGNSGIQGEVQRTSSPVSFELDVLPVLTAYGCNMGACHGKQRGQNGFQLSLLAFDPEFDFAALTQDARGRRLFPAAPE